MITTIKRTSLEILFTGDQMQVVQTAFTGSEYIKPIRGL